MIAESADQSQGQMRVWDKFFSNSPQKKAPLSHNPRTASPALDAPIPLVLLWLNIMPLPMTRWARSVRDRGEHNRERALRQLNARGRGNALLAAAPRAQEKAGKTSRRSYPEPRSPRGNTPVSLTPRSGYQKRGTAPCPEGPASADQRFPHPQTPAARAKLLYALPAS